MNKVGPVVFFGSGPVAAASLRLLVEHCDVEMVITKPRAVHHRGSVPVLALAEELSLPVMTVSTKSELDQAITAHAFASKVGVLIDFGIIVSDQTIQSFPLGIINSHFSILPELRGADPITFAILSGQSTTGVSLMRIVPALDEGPLLGFDTIPLTETKTAPALTTELIALSDSLLIKLLPGYLNGELQLQPQSITNRSVSYTRKLTKQDAMLDWHKSASQLDREIRAFQGWPGSKTTLGEVDITVEKAHIESGSGIPGTIHHTATTLGVQTKNGRLVIDQLKPAGKKSMTTQAFLAGYRNRLPH